MVLYYRHKSHKLFRKNWKGRLGKIGFWESNNLTSIQIAFREFPGNLFAKRIEQTLLLSLYNVTQ